MLDQAVHHAVLHCAPMPYFWPRTEGSGYLCVYVHLLLLIKSEVGILHLPHIPHSPGLYCVALAMMLHPSWQDAVHTCMSAGKMQYMLHVCMSHPAPAWTVPPTLCGMSLGPCNVGLRLPSWFS